MDIDAKIASVITDTPECNYTTRVDIAEKIADIVTCEHSFTTLINQKDKILLKDGICTVPDFADAEGLREHLLTKQLYNSHVPHGDGILRSLEDTKRFFRGCYALKDILSYRPVLEYTLHPMILNHATNYLGCIPTIYSINSFWSFNTGSIHVQRLHRDYDDYKFLSLFVYLTDVDEYCGPHLFVKGTHNNLAGDSDDFFRLTFDSEHLLGDRVEKNQEIIIGKAGTARLLDTYGLHRGRVPTKDRLVLWIRYGLHKNPPCVDQVKTPESAETLGLGDFLNNKKNRYMLRCILN